MSDERRRGIRLPGKFWVRIVGMETEAILRHGDISVSGALFQCEREIGQPGSVERLEISDEKRTSTATVLACLVRTLTVQDLWQGHAPDRVAFEFIEPEEAARSALAKLVRIVAEQAADTDGIMVDKPTTADVAGAMRKARLAAVQGEAIYLETSWPVERGTAVRLELDPPTGSAPLEVRGIVRSSRAGEGESYRVEVTLGAEASANGGNLENALTSLLAGVVGAEESGHSERATPSLMGSMQRVPLPTLLSLLENERVTGTLHLINEGREVEIFVKLGRVIDAVAPSDPGPRAALREVLSWPDGSFRLAAGEVDRDPRIEVGTNALVLDLLREIDEGASS